MRMGPGNTWYPAGAPLKVTIDLDAKMTRVHLCGELDLSTICALDAVVDKVLRSGSSVLALDVSDLTFCDAAGLSALVSVHRRLTREDRELRVTGVQPRLHRLLRLTGLEELLVTV